MNDDISPEDQRALQDLAQAVAQQLAEGREKHAIAEDLTRNRGFGQDEAIEFVETIDAEVKRMHASPGHGHARSGHGGGGGGGSGAMGWLIWIGAIVLFNVLSYAFGWGFICW